jgi:mannose-6-phosphate isomerase class I
MQVNLTQARHRDVNRDRPDAMSYVLTMPSEPSFSSDGLIGYQFNLSNSELDLYYIDVIQGHDTFMISKALTRIYYVLEGRGYFTIASEHHDVSAGMVVEVPPQVEYCYSGTMKLILISYPLWFQGNEQFTRLNPDVRRTPRASLLKRISLKMKSRLKPLLTWWRSDLD